MRFAHTRPGKRIEETHPDVERLPPSPFAADTVFDDPLARIAPKTRGHLLADRYALEQSISRLGGVFVAKDVTLRRRVVVKMLRRNWARDALMRDRFRQSVLALSSVDHDNVVRVLDLVVAESALVMEYVAGRSLEQWVREKGPLEPRRAVRIATQIASGLDAAHRAGLVHGRLTAADIILCPDRDGRETPKIVGFELTTGADDDPVDGFNVDRERASDAIERRRRAREDFTRVGQLLILMLTANKPRSGGVVLDQLRSELEQCADSATAENLIGVVEHAVGKVTPRQPASSDRPSPARHVVFRLLLLACVVAMLGSFLLTFYLARQQAARIYRHAQPANLASPARR